MTSIRNWTIFAAVTLVLACGVCSANIITIAGARQSNENAAVTISDVSVSRAFSDFFYVQDQDSKTGICVRYNRAIPAAGSVVTVSGSVKTINGKLGINANTVTVEASSSVVTPLGMSCATVGGVVQGNQQGTTILKNALEEDSAGASNIGLLVKVWGKLTPVSASRALVSDGSGVDLSVIAPPGYTFDDYYAPYPFVVVTGISSCEMVSGSLRPVVRLSALSDLEELTDPTPAPPRVRNWLRGLTDDGTASLGKLLSDNRFYYGPSILTGVTYSYPDPPANPADVSPWPGRRLLDGRGSGDWSMVVGKYGAPLVVSFDFKRICTFTEIDIAPFNNEKNYVKIETATRPNGPWVKVLERAKADAPGAYIERLPLPTTPNARYMKITIDGNQCNSLCQVWAWGDAVVNATYPEAVDPVYPAQNPGNYSIPGIDSTTFTNGAFTAWRNQLGSFADQPAVWSSLDTWGVITSGGAAGPILPNISSVAGGQTISIKMAKNMTEQRAFALTNTALTERSINVALGDFTKDGALASNISGSLRVMASMPYLPEAGKAYLFPMFAADNMLGDGLMERYFPNGKYIRGFPNVTLTPGGSAVFWVSITTDGCAPGVYRTALSAAGGSPVTLEVTVYDITLPSPSPTWVHTWGTMTREQVPFTYDGWMEKQVDHAISLGTNTWYGWPTPGTAAAMARAKSPRMMFNIHINYQSADLAAEVNSLVAQAQALGLNYDEWYVELYDEPGVAGAEAFGQYCQAIKAANPNVHIYIDPALWQDADQVVFDVFGPWYNDTIDISVPSKHFVNPLTKPLSFSLWDYPRFVNAQYHHDIDGLSDADAEVMRKFAWMSMDHGWNGWGIWTYSAGGSWPYAPYDDPWTILDEMGNVTVLDHMMAYPGPEGPVDTRRSEGIRAGWEDYCLLALMKERGLTSEVNTVLTNYRSGATLQSLREQMIDYLK